MGLTKYGSHLSVNYVHYKRSRPIFFHCIWTNVWCCRRAFTAGENEQLRCVIGYNSHSSPRQSPLDTWRGLWGGLLDKWSVIFISICELTTGCHLQCYHVKMLLSYHVTVLQCYYVTVTVLPHNNLIVLPCNHVTVLLSNYLIVLSRNLQSYHVKMLLCYHVTVLQCYYVTVLQW